MFDVAAFKLLKEATLPLLIFEHDLFYLLVLFNKSYDALILVKNLLELIQVYGMLTVLIFYLLCSIPIKIGSKSCYLCTASQDTYSPISDHLIAIVLPVITEPYILIIMHLLYLIIVHI